MRKKLLPLAIAAAMAPGFASAAEVSGFVDIIYTIGDSASDVPGGTNETIGKFTADGEIDFISSPADGVTTRVDLDVTADNASIEQALFAWGAAEGVTVIGGIFNNPIGYEAEDAPDMDFTTHGAVYTALDSQTALDGDNIAGLAVAFAAGPATITAALTNDLNQVDEANTFALVANMSPMTGLDLELAFATQTGNAVVDKEADGKATSVGNVINFNAVYSGIENVTLGLDYLTGSAALDSAYDVWAGYQMDKIGVKVRYSQITFNEDDIKDIVAADATAGDQLTAIGLPAGSDLTSTSIYLSYQVASNLSAALEVSSYDSDAAGADTEDLTTLELIATF